MRNIDKKSFFKIFTYIERFRLILCLNTIFNSNLFIELEKNNIVTGVSFYFYFL